MKCLPMAGFALLLASSLGAQGHRLTGSQVLVDESHWQNWNHPRDLLVFSDEGVQPRFIRQQINAVLDAASFTYGDGLRGGIRGAGSNEQAAANIIDGREETVWEPDLNAPLTDWWVEIDLGRVVWARKIVVKFAAEGIGDPFLQFRVLTANGMPAFSQRNSLRFIRAGRSEGLNKSQHTFEFDVKPSQEADEGFSGDLFQYLQIVATGSDLGRAQEISQDHWNRLPEEKRGDVVYFLRESSGVDREVDEDQYRALARDLQGPILHYRRERPQLAEVEVWTVGDNISLGALDRGGAIGGTSKTGTEAMAVDGDYRSVWTEQVGVSGGANIQVPFDRELDFDLGAWFWINRVVFSFDRDNIVHCLTGAFPNYVLNLSDGLQNPGGSLAYVSLAERGTAEVEPGNFSGLFPHVFYHDNAFSLTKARFFQISYRVKEVPNCANSGIRELQLYGHGFLPRVSMESAMIELGANPRILSTIHWDADTEPDTEVQVRTRTGDQLEQQIRYFNDSGLEVTEDKYRKLLSFLKGDSTISVVAGEGWSNWSKVYTTSGAAITSPSPRRYVMVQTTLVSEDPERAARLRNLHIELDTPLASQILGKISPRRTLRRGESETFTLRLRPVFQTNNQGFDQLLVELPPGAEVELVDVQVGSESELEAGSGRVFGPDELELMDSGPDSLWVRLPTSVEDAQEQVALRFSGALFLASNTFTSSVGLGTEEARIWQRVDVDGASELGEGMTVFTPFDGGLVGEVEVASNPFTPNGDGINDAVRMVFPVFKVQGSKALVLEVYGLDGRLVRRLEQPAEYAAGLQQVSWDGRDDSGRLQPPGLYICRVGVEVDADGGDSMVTRIVSSVY